MNRSLIVIALVLIANAVFGEIVVTSNGMIRVGNREMTRKELHDKIHRIQQKKTGGIIREANSAKGAFVVLNGQKRIDTKTLRSLEPMIDKWLRIPMVFTDGEPVTIQTARKAIKAAGGTVGVAVVDVEGLPGLLPAPEDGWAIVNVNRLAEDKPSDVLLAERTRKEILRGLAFITGCAYATKADYLMRNVRQPADLDALRGEQFGVEVINLFLQSAPIYGLTPWRQASYLKACEQGWAPAPTNEFQKAIWDKVHAPPKNPMKIEFDPKKGR